MNQPAQPGSVDPGDVLANSRKIHSIGADIAASVLRRCAYRQEAIDVLHDAINQVNTWFSQKSKDGIRNG